MTLGTRTGLRSCGKRFATEDEARHSKKYLAGGYDVARCRYGCGGVHLADLARLQADVDKALTRARENTAKDTGPSRKVRALVAARDGYACVCCSRSVIGQQADLQHRDSRGMGGTSDPAANSPVNLLLMLRECHARVESRKFPEDNDKGYWLKMGQNPADEPVMYFGQDGGFTAWLLADGSLSFDGPQAGAA
jgi:hypothetical protein